MNTNHSRFGRRRVLMIAIMLLWASVAGLAVAVEGATSVAKRGETTMLAQAKAAHARGDYEIALPLWVQLAEQGDVKAAQMVGLIYHQGLGARPDYQKAMSWYLKAYPKDANAMNNVGVLYRDGLGVSRNRKISYLLFLTIHMTGHGNEETVMRANRNLRRELTEVPEHERQQALCVSLQALDESIRTPGAPLRAEIKPGEKRIRDLDWWLPGELAEFNCGA